MEGFFIFKYLRKLVFKLLGDRADKAYAYVLELVFGVSAVIGVIALFRLNVEMFVTMLFTATLSFCLALPFMPGEEDSTADEGAKDDA